MNNNLINDLALNNKQSKVYKSYLTSTNFSESMILEVIHTLCNLTSENEKKTDIRIYQNSRKNETLRKKIFSPTNIQYKSVKEWYEKALDGNDFFLVINKAEMLSEALTEELIKVVSYPLSRLIEDFTCEAVIFIGNYKYTPFGIHKDDSDGLKSTVLHFHLGPNSKTIYTWDEIKTPSIYHSMLPNEKILQEAESYLICPNDAFLLPGSDLFHIGKSNGFSIGITLVVESVTSATLLQRVLRKNLKELEIEIAKCDKFDNLNLNSIEKCLNVIESNNLSLKNWIINGIHDLNFRKKSANYFLTSPIVSNLEFDIKNNYSKNEYYNIFYRFNSSDIEVYARFSKITIKYNAILIDFLDFLNNSLAINYEKIQNSFGTQISFEVIKFLMNFFIKQTIYKQN